MDLSPIDLRSGPDSASLVPGRGAIVTRWHARGRERLYLDEATLKDPTKNVRGGVPLLFPSPGKLAGGKFARDGRSGEMKQHGFARDLPWTVKATESDSVRLELVSSDVTRAQFAWDFALDLRVSIASGTLRLDLSVRNTGSQAMPFGFGIHPYFLVHDKAHATISTRATRAFDNVTGRTVPFAGFHLDAGETDLHLVDHGSAESTLSADGANVTVRTDPAFSRWVVWTLPGKDFVCLEPWTCPGDALNTGDGLFSLPAGGEKALSIVLEAS